MTNSLTAYRSCTKIAVCCNVLQCVAVCCSVLQCVAVLEHVTQWSDAQNDYYGYLIK